MQNATKAEQGEISLKIKSCCTAAPLSCLVVVVLNGELLYIHILQNSLQVVTIVLISSETQLIYFIIHHYSLILASPDIPMYFRSTALFTYKLYSSGD